MNGKIKEAAKSVLCIGLGRVGLPQALKLAQDGFRVYAFDGDIKTIHILSDGKTPFYEPEMDEWLHRTLHRTFIPLSSWEEISENLSQVSAIFFAVGTQTKTSEDVLNHNEIDLSAYYSLLDNIFKQVDILQEGIALIICTTMPLGGTDHLKQHIETKYSVKEGNTFHLAVVPERIIEGDAIHELKVLPRIVGTYSDHSFEVVSEFFKLGHTTILRVKNPISAEFCKLTENAFRNTMFSFSNEIAMYSSTFDINIQEIIKVVNDSYPRNHIPQPGFVSGYCLTKDPYIFEMDFLKRFKNRNFQSVWFYGRRTNDYLMEFLILKVIENIKNIKECHVSILGLSFKGNVDDFRLSHSLQLMERLVELGVHKFNVYDPFLEKNKYTQLDKNLLSYVHFKSDSFDKESVSNCDVIIVCNRDKYLRGLDGTDLLLSILEHTNKPCYLFDILSIWESASKLAHICYDTIGFNHHRLNKKAS